MTKLSKKIRKISKNPGPVLYLGEKSNLLEEILESVDTIFWIYAEGEKIKSKNLIFLEDFKIILSTADIEMIFLTESSKEKLLKIQSLIEKFQPLILVESKEQISIEDVLFFKKIHYHNTEGIPGFKTWKKIK